MSNALCRCLAAVSIFAAGWPVLAQGEPAAPPAAPSGAAPPAAPAPKIKSVSNPPFGMFKNEKLPMIQRSVLKDVSGRIDRMAVDLVSNRLFVAAKNKGSIEMLDIDGSKQQPAITDLPEPGGVLVISDMRKLIVGCGGDNSVRVYNLSPTGDPTEERTIKFAGETDPIRYDPAGQRVYVGHGKFMSSFDPQTGEKGPMLELPGMPEGFVIDPTSSRVYINIAQTGQVVVAERSDSGELKIAEIWTLKDLKGNFPMALDPVAGHLFIVCRNPSKFVVLDTKTGNQLGALEVTEDADDCWWDMVQKRIYVSAGGNGGFVDCYEQMTEGGRVSGYTRYHQQRTNVGCRTSVFVPEQRRLIVAAPSLGNDPTFIYVFIVGP
jgi:hypothetical protein